MENKHLALMSRLWSVAWILSALLLSSAKPVEPRTRVVPPWEEWGGEHRALVIGAAIQHGVPARILHRIIEAESGYTVRAVGHNTNGTRDLGICQLNTASLPTFEALFNAGQPIDPFDPSQAIPIAAKYLRSNYDALGSWWCAVAAYNCGAGRVRSRTIPASTVRYVAKVMR